MSNFFDYLDWRSDLKFQYSEFNEIDCLILAQIAYLNFDDLIKSSFSSKIDLFSLCNNFEKSDDFSIRSNTGALINSLTVKLFLQAAKSPRFSDIQITDYVSYTSRTNAEQFAAMTFLIDDNNCLVVYRGTDDSIVGWKEDFNLAVMDEVPAQKDAANYLKNVAGYWKGNIMISGHSKGGNLGVFAASKMNNSVKNRITKIFNFDGPGFPEDKFNTVDFSSITPVLKSFYPQLSIVGMIFSNSGCFDVIESDQIGIMQHDPFSWHIKGTNFVTLQNLDFASDFFHITVNSWLNELNQSDRELLVDTLFNIIESTDAQTNSEIEENVIKNSFKIFNSIIKLDPELRNKCYKIVEEFFNTAQKKLPTFETIMQNIKNPLKEKQAELLKKFLKEK